MIAYYVLRWMGLILVGLMIYGQTFGFDFVFDDNLFIINNPLIKNFSNFHVIWHSFPLTRFVGMCSFALNYHFDQLDPRGYHIFNFMVHLTATGLAWALAGLLFKIVLKTETTDRLTKELPFIIAVVFLVHPGQTQAVTYITQRFESMSTVLYLATMYFYLCARLSTQLTRKIVLFGLAGLSTVLGILTKEVVITIPAMIMVSEWILFHQKDKRKLYTILVIAGILLFFLFSKFLHAGLEEFSETFASESHDGDILTPGHYFLTQMRVFLTFLRLLVLPIHQCLDYDYPASTGLLSPPLTLVGLCTVIGFIFLIIKLRRSFPLISYGLAWVLVTFSINMAPRSNVIFEHKLYLISFGFILATVAALSVLVPDRWTVFKVLWCIIIVLAITSFHRNKVWANELTLWEDAIRVSPNKARVNASLGRVYAYRGRYDEAIHYLNRAVVLNPNNITYENLGVIYSKEGRNLQALENFNKSIRMDPAYPITYVKRSWVYQSRHDYKAALSDLARAIQLDPYLTDAFLERGMLWAQLGQMQQAAGDFQRVLEIDPYNSQAARLRSYCLAKMPDGTKDKQMVSSLIEKKRHSAAGLQPAPSAIPAF